jgi:hypothetical protein
MSSRIMSLSAETEEAHMPRTSIGFVVKIE